MKKIKLGDACEILNGFAFKSENYVGSGIRVIRISNVQKGYIEDNTPAFYPLETKGLEKYMLEEGDLLISLTGNVGRVAILEKEFMPAALNQRVACLRLKTDKLSKRYLFHILNSDFFEKQCIQYSKGVAQKNMSTAWLKDYEILLYSKEQQELIADILDKMRLIKKSRYYELQKLDELVKARFVEMFGDENNSKGWEIVNIEDVANVQVGVVIKPSQYYTDQYNGIKAFRSLNIADGYIKDDDWVYFSKEGNKKNKKSILSTNDVLVVRSGAPGTACVVTSEYAGSNAIDVIIAHPDFQKVDSRYLCTYTNMPHGKSQIIEGTGGAAQQHFNVGKYNKLKLMLPPLEYQKQYVKFLEEIDKSRSRIQKSLEASQELFDSLMQEYFG